MTDLVNAIDAANTAGSGDLLLAPGCTYTLTAADSDEDGLPVITGDITLVGASTTITRSSTAPDFRIFEVAEGGNLTLSALTVNGGKTTGDGGGILNNGTVTLNATAVRNSQAAGEGGGVANHGTLNVNAGSRISYNSAVTGGGGILNTATLDITASSIDHNSITGTDALGGGLFNSGGDVTADLSSVGSNSALAAGASGAGVATVGGTAELNLDLVGSNVANTAPGGIYNDGTTLTLTFSLVAGNSPSNCTGSPSPVPGCLG
ncbi:hypothetical protein E1265_08490 [Streptomyces sp. 8K308]|uniref:hypothetical protein n=1 Tax=Streptomyces sp. 8K308 TaxID=2530388 RepID=UPI00104CA90A|nr:hypothetical protein [Streptomyces sp. 8K308]TDC24917.1 hypothetical protein E1265_08490 [Streptomyces sp. 8K308]